MQNELTLFRKMQEGDWYAFNYFSILLCFKELMVEINIVGFHLIQFTSGNQGFYKQGVELVCRIEIIGGASAVPRQAKATGWVRILGRMRTTT